MMKLALSLLPLLTLGQFTGPGFDIKATNPADLPQWGNTWNQTINGTTVWSSKNAVLNVIPTYAISRPKVVAGAVAPALATFNGKYYSCLMNGGLWDSSAKTCAASTTTGQYSYKNIFAGLLVPGTKSKQGTNLDAVNFCNTTTVTNTTTNSVTTTYSWITPNSSTPTATIPANYFCAIQLGKEEVGYASTIQLYSDKYMRDDFEWTHNGDSNPPSMNTLVSLEYVNKDGYDMTYQNNWKDFVAETNTSYNLVNFTGHFQTGWMNEHHGRFQQIVFFNNYYTSTGSSKYTDFYASQKSFKIMVTTPAPGFFHRTAAKIIQTAKNNLTLIIILAVVAVLAVGGAVGGWVHHMRMKKAKEAATEIRTTDAKQDDSQRNMINMMNIEKSADVPKDKQ